MTSIQGGPSSSSLTANIVPLLIEAAYLGDDNAVAQLLSDEELITVDEASKADTKLTSKHFGLSALHRARTPEVAKVLLQFGVPVDCKGAFGQTPLHTCCQNPAVIQLLLENGANIDAITEDGSTPLEWAVIADSVESAKLFLEKGANVQCRNNMGNTPLHLVTSKRMAELLLSFGAKVSIENHEGKIPLETSAERSGSAPDLTAITELLLEVSEDRGLRYRSSKSLFAGSTTTGNGGSSRATGSSSNRDLTSSATRSKDVGEEAKTSKSRWAFVKQKLIKDKRKAEEEPISAAKARVMMICEWSNDKNNICQSSFAESIRSLKGTDGHSDYDLERDGASSGRFTRQGSSGAEDADLDHSAAAAGDETETVLADEDDDDPNDQGENGEFYLRFFEMAIRERPFLAKKMLDRQRTFLYNKGTCKYYRYDLSLLGGIDSVSEALRLIVECDRRDLVAHDVVQWLVTAKWGLFVQSYVNHETALYVVFMVLFTLSALKPWAPSFVTAYQFWIDLGLVTLSFRYIYRLYLEWRHRGATREVAMSIFRSDRFTGPVFFLVLVIEAMKHLSLQSDPNYYSKEIRTLETIGSVMVWMRLLYYAEPQYQPIGLAMSIVRRMIVDISVYLVILLVFLLGFSQAMTVAFRPETSLDDPKAEINENFDSPLSSFRTLLFFIFSMDQSSVLDEKDDSKRAMGMWLLALYETLVVVVFLNLVIAVMTTTFEDVMSNAQTEWLLVRAKICVKLEDQTTAWLFRRDNHHPPTSLGHNRSGKKRKRPKKSVIVVEHANGENDVSLPMSMLPPFQSFRIAVRKAWASFLHRLNNRGGSNDRGEYESLETTPDNKRISPARPAFKRSDSFTVRAITGSAEPLVHLGTFTRFAFSSSAAQSSSSPEAESGTEPGILSSGSSAIPAFSGVGAATARAEDRKESLVAALRLALAELEAAEK